ncbi:MAG: phosphoribosylformylglycinamidine synthase subunit PurS [Dehalococcoidia bacterium]|jgi:phosphoribosylformylglycinamidine synthase|nr:phosphoribosylformylglycinamidine synthase subunit PurS [Dehalococcoidia bacterium]|tara:strand:- start:301 stop:558 length:258 start_codon:yes stop_codon:yes gene_type:complete
MIFQSTIYVKYKSGISDPESINILSALDKLSFDSVKNLSTGKFFEIKIESKDLKTAHKEIKEICNQLLINPVIEQFEYKVSEFNQ